MVVAGVPEKGSRDALSETSLATLKVVAVQPAFVVIDWSTLYWRCNRLLL